MGQGRLIGCLILDITVLYFVAYGALMIELIDLVDEGGFIMALWVGISLLKYLFEMVAFAFDVSLIPCV